MNNAGNAADTPTGYLAIPESGSGPGVLVLHAWWGLTPFFRSVCDRFAAAGFVAFAPDLNKGKIAHTVQEAEDLNSERNVEETRMTLLRALEYVQQLPSVNRAGLGVVGWSLGAFWTIRLSAMVPDAIRAAVLFYGTGAADFGQAKAAFLGHFAEQDPWEPLDDVRQMETAMRQAGVSLTVHMYPEVGHWFFEDDRPEHYDPDAAALAWQRTIEFLQTHLSGS